jgi:D-glycero-D-manno-heptose 1,7-bisphosphate phosphatase
MSAEYSNIAVFIDRDGTINTELNNGRPALTPEEFVLIPKVGEAISKINKLGLKTIVITSQSSVAKGHITEDTLLKIHDRMNELLAEYDAHVDDIFYCPHYPYGKVPKYSKDCDCRKPKPGLIKLAEEKYKLYLPSCFCVGDMIRDFELGYNLNMRTILVLTGKGKKTQEELLKIGRNPEYIATDLFDAVNYIKTTLSKNQT